MISKKKTDKLKPEQEARIDDMMKVQHLIIDTLELNDISPASSVTAMITLIVKLGVDSNVEIEKFDIFLAQVRKLFLAVKTESN